MSEFVRFTDRVNEALSQGIDGIIAVNLASFNAVAYLDSIAKSSRIDFKTEVTFPDVSTNTRSLVAHQKPVQSVSKWFGLIKPNLRDYFNPQDFGVAKDLLQFHRLSVQQRKFWNNTFTRTLEKLCIDNVLLIAFIFAVLSFTMSIETYAHMQKLGAGVGSIDWIMGSILQLPGTVLMGMLLIARSVSALTAMLALRNITHETKMLQLQCNLPPVQTLFHPKILAVACAMPLLYLVVVCATSLGILSYWVLTSKATVLFVLMKLVKAFRFKNFFNALVCLFASGLWVGYTMSWSALCSRVDSNTVVLNAVTKSVTIGIVGLMCIQSVVISLMA